ncbi:MAG: hypothetical protein HXS41_12280 [Theionarchaea archaeon]|nr:hypothetical protein [Theionarchaea archaeon]MBU7021829.1 hypothetical protein [Theionarchaea archaeon]
MNQEEELEPLRATLGYMKENLLFYERILEKVDIETFELKDLPTLPITTKDHLKRNPEGFIAHTLVPEHVTWTGGTTGNAIPVYYAREELAAMYGNPPERKSRFLGILVHNTDHGLPLKVPTEVFWLDHFLDANVHTRNLENIISDLTHTHAIPGVDSSPSIISFTSQENLKALTLELVRRGLDTVSVKYIFGTGDYISPYWIRLVEQVFNGKYIDCYANTETAAVAARLPCCNYFHFNPTVIPEVVDTETYEPLTTGSGYLLVTTVYPYRQMQLLLRYNTEDIVEIRQCSEGFAFELQGRSEELAFIHDTCVSFKTFLDIVDDIPDIWMREPYCYKPVRIDVNRERSEITVTLYLNYPPGMYPGRVAEIQKTMTDQVFRAYPELRGKVNLTFDFREKLHTVYDWPQPMRSFTASQRIIVERAEEEIQEGIYCTE